MQTKQIHIKATCENENRRFCISEAKFDTLKQYISNLFSIERGIEFTVKYKDDENDLVTISSDEELAFSINLFPTDILRLIVELAKQSVEGELKAEHPNCTEKKWRCRGKQMPLDNDRRNHWLLAKRERVQAKLLSLEGPGNEANPKLLWKQKHLEQKLQSLDEKIANKESGGCHRGPMQEKRCEFLVAKKERILACLKELEGADFQAYPGLFWKQEHLERKLQVIEAKLANKEPAEHCHKFGGRHGNVRGRHCHMNPRGSGGRHCHKNQFGPMDERHIHFLSAKKERIQRRLKEMEGTDFQAHPDLFWKQEHLKKKLQNIESRLAIKDAAPVAAYITGVAPSALILEPAPVSNDEIKKIRENLKIEKQAAVANYLAKKESYQNAKLQHQGKVGVQKEEIAKFHEEFLKAKEVVAAKKLALCEFNARTRADREKAKC